MGFVLPHLFSQVYFALDEPVPPCDFFFLGGTGRREGGLSLNTVLHCKSTFSWEKKVLPSGP